MQERRCAITSIELATAVAAAAILLGMLAPVLASGRRQSKQSVCLYNLARIAQASVTYASIDPGGTGIPIHPDVEDASATSRGRRTMAYFCWGGKSGCGEFENAQEFYGTSAGRGPASRPLNEILYGDVFPDYTYRPGPDFANWISDAELELSVYHCPSDSGYKGIHHTEWRDSGRTSYDEYGTSYGANALWIFYVGGSYCQSNSPFARPLSDIVDPAKTILYQENCGLFAYLAYPKGSPGQECSGAYYETVDGWHGRPWWFNAAFADGHADLIRMKGYDNPYLGHYPGGCSSGSWMCVTMRGRNWQKDTLPLAPVTTDIWCGGSKSCGGDDAEGGVLGEVREVMPEIDWE